LPWGTKESISCWHVEVVHDDAFVTKMHLEILWKQSFLWKPHYRTSLTWAFLKVNSSQSMDLEHNQFMRCIVYHSDSISPKILAMCTKCRKGWLHNMSNGIITMTKHVEGEHSPLMKRFVEDLNYIIVAKAPTNWNANKKRACVFPFEISGFFLLKIK